MNRTIGLFFISCLFILIAVAMVGCIGYAGPVGPSSGSANESSRGTVAANPASVSFGSVAIGNSSSQSVSLTNPSRKTIVISNLSTSNTAFVSSGLTFPLDLAPGQSATFRVAFAPRTIGDFRGTIGVATDASNSTALIGVSGSGTERQQAGVIAASTANLNLGSVVVGSAGTQSFSVTNTGGMTAILSSVNSSSAAFTASGPTFPMNITPGQTVPFTVTFTPTAAGDATGVITVGSNASNAPTTVAVAGTGTSKQQPGILSTSSTNVNLGSVSIGKTATQSFTVTNTGGMTAILSSVSSSATAFTASGPTFPMDIKPGQSVPFTVSFAPTASGNASATITVSSNASNAPTIVAVSGTGAATPTPGALSANPSTVSIGNVNVGSTGSQSFSLTNTGGTAVNILSISSSTAAFTVTGPTLPMTLAAGQSVSVKVTFAPTSAGNASGTITLTSDASNKPTSVAVSGAGVTPGTAPTISSQPANQTVVAGQTAAFTVTASGTGPLSYQWKKNGAAIGGATSASYATAATTSADNGASFTVVVSNSAGSVTSNAATLTVNAAMLSLSANPTSLSFGSVNVGSNTSQSVTFTNDGNSDVTVSNVSVSGAGFNATGISAGQVVTAGKTATLNVTFAPSASGALSGSVAVTSNAPTSPLTVALSGTGLSAAPPSVSGAPTCGKNNDTTNHVPTDWSTFVPPAKGQSYVDPTFGCTVTRITDVSTEDQSGSVYLPITMGYATVSPFNANDTYLMLEDGWNRHFVTDLSGNIVVSIANMPSENDGWALWDASDPNVFYYTSENSLMKGTIAGSSVTASTVHSFSEYAAVNFMDETDVSQDGQHVVLIGGDNSGSSPENIFDYNFVTNLKGPVYSTQCTGVVNNSNNGCLHKLIQTPDNNIIIQFAGDGSGSEQGNRLWTGSKPLTALQDGTNHLDSGEDMNGNPVFIEVGNSAGGISGETNPCPSGWGLDVRQIYDVMSSVCLLDNPPSWHVGYRGGPNQPWVGLSFFDQRSSGPEYFDKSSSYAAPDASNWQLYEDEIMLVRIDANNSPTYIYRLARAYSRSAQDFDAQPHAAISRDGKYLAFGSDMAYAHTGCPANFQTSTNCTDVYVIKVK